MWICTVVYCCCCLQQMSHFSPILSIPLSFSVGPFLVSAQGDDEDVVMDEGESVSIGGGEEDEEDDMEVEDEEDDEPVKVPDVVSVHVVFSYHWCGYTSSYLSGR